MNKADGDLYVVDIDGVGGIKVRHVTAVTEAQANMRALKLALHYTETTGRPHRVIDVRRPKA